MEFPFSARSFGDPQQRLLRGIPAFAALPDSARKALVGHLTEQSYPQFAQILDEGEPADRLFLIEEGEVEVSIRTPEGRAPLCHLGEGEMFGEIGLLLPSRKRTARVRSLTPLLTSTLRLRHLNEVLDHYPEARDVLLEAADHALVRSFVKCTRPFERLTPERLRHFGQRLKTESFPAGATVFRQGERGDVCYLVRSGVIEVVRDEAGGPRTVARLEVGEIVGESALLTSTPRDASLVVVENAELLALHRSDLIDVLDHDKQVAAHIVRLMKLRDRPRAKTGIALQPRPTASGETIWILADPNRLGGYHQLSSLGLFVWRHLDGANNVEEIAALYRAQRGSVEVEEIARIVAELVQSGFATGKELDAEVALVAGPPLPWWQKWWARFTLKRE